MKSSRTSRRRETKLPRHIAAHLKNWDRGSLRALQNSMHELPLEARHTMFPPLLKLVEGGQGNVLELIANYFHRPIKETFGYPAFVTRVLDFSHHSSSGVRADVALALETLQDRIPAQQRPAVLACLLELTEDLDAYVRRKAIEALPKINDFIPREQIGAISDRILPLTKDPEAAVCRAAQDCLADLQKLPPDWDEQGAIPEVKDLEDAFPDLPAEGRDAAVARLLEFLEHGLGRVRGVAMRSLSESAALLSEAQRSSLAHQLLKIARDEVNNSEKWDQEEAIRKLGDLLPNLPNDSQELVCDFLFEMAENRELDDMIDLLVNGVESFSLTRREWIAGLTLEKSHNLAHSREQQGDPFSPNIQRRCACGFGMWYDFAHGYYPHDAMTHLAKLARHVPSRLDAIADRLLQLVDEEHGHVAAFALYDLIERLPEKKQRPILERLKEVPPGWLTRPRPLDGSIP